ncbi:hypothetical protein [Haloarcula sediminis]|uniref:hypothetical protein n=1 Tax=Haloarcula sediminis TaxID=3111777 RepID=UPI002D77E17B|nr:hypothetical protein [Haloarcula sp. CK38]
MSGREYDFDLPARDDDYVAVGDRPAARDCVALGEQKEMPPGRQQSAIAHDGPKRAAATFEQGISFTSDVEYTPQRGKAGDEPLPSEEWDQNEYQHNPRGSDDAGSKVSGLPKRQFKLQQGQDVAVPDGGDWFETTDGDATDLHDGAVRSELEALMQGAGIGRERQGHVLALLADEDYSAWSSFGGATAAACGVLLALDDDRAKQMANRQLREKVRWWADVKGIEHPKEAFESFCEKLLSHATERVL